MTNEEKEFIIDEAIRQGKICPYCGAASVLTDSREIYGVSYGNIWICRPCNAYVGVHKTGKLKDVPLGRLANAELRLWKKNAYAVFDPIWKNFLCDRSVLYAKMAEYFNIDVSECHIGMFDVDQCKKVIEFIDHFKTTLNEK